MGGYRGLRGPSTTERELGLTCRSSTAVVCQRDIPNPSPTPNMVNDTNKEVASPFPTRPLPYLACIQSSTHQGQDLLVDALCTLYEPVGEAVALAEHDVIQVRVLHYAQVVADRFGLEVKPVRFHVHEF